MIASAPSANSRRWYPGVAERKMANLKPNPRITLQERWTSWDRRTTKLKITEAKMLEPPSFQRGSSSMASWTVSLMVRFHLTTLLFQTLKEGQLPSLDLWSPKSRYWTILTTIAWSAEELLYKICRSRVSHPTNSKLCCIVMGRSRWLKTKICQSSSSTEMLPKETFSWSPFSSTSSTLASKFRSRAYPITQRRISATFSLASREKV
jgi:hypothetical protein